jgi:hypothetical protein
MTGIKYEGPKEESPIKDLAVFMEDAGNDLYWLWDSVNEARKSMYADASELLETLLWEVQKIAESLKRVSRESQFKN